MSEPKFNIGDLVELKEGVRMFVCAREEVYGENNPDTHWGYKLSSLKEKTESIYPEQGKGFIGERALTLIKETEEIIPRGTLVEISEGNNKGLRLFVDYKTDYGSKCYSLGYRAFVPSGISGIIEHVLYCSRESFKIVLTEG